MRIVGYILIITLSAGLLLGLGVSGAWRQHQRLNTFKTTPATVTHNEVRASSAGGFEPWVTYTYRAGGENHESEQVAPLRINGSRAWAESISQRIDAEGSTAYVNPNAPDKAYLLPIGRFRPYGLMLIGMTVLGFGLLPLVSGGVFAHHPGPIAKGPYDWYILAPSSSVPERAFAWVSATVLWYMLGAMAVGHYTMAVASPYEFIAPISAGLFALAGLWPACQAWRNVHTASSLDAPRVTLTRRTVALDEPIIVRVDQPFSRATHVQEVKVALSCIQQYGLSRLSYYTSSRIALKDRAVHVRERVQGEYTFEVPAKKRRPSTRHSRFTFPRTEWVIEVTLRTDKTATTVSFPITAERTQRQRNVKAA